MNNNRFCAILFTNILFVSIGLKQISNIDAAINYKTIRVHAAEAMVRGGLANHNTLDKLTNLSPLRISEGGAY